MIIKVSYSQPQAHQFLNSVLSTYPITYLLTASILYASLSIIATIYFPIGIASSSILKAAISTS
jgi:hypothetical protein